MNVSELKPGDDHYMAYVGPPDQYDFMGATQFRLLTTLGLRANHSLLDFGCGSLRTGRLFLSYLDAERYFGIEPSKRLIEDAINNQVGNDLIAIKKPHFDHNSDFKTDVFSTKFDFIIAQSIFSHTSMDLTNIALRNFKESLNPNGLIAATFVEGVTDSDDEGWVYPGCVTYRRSTIKKLAEKVDLFVIRLPWYHPSQTWYLLAANRNRLPSKAMLRHLNGAVLFDPEHTGSWKLRQRIMRSIKTPLKQALPRPIREGLKKMLANKQSI